MEKRFLILHPKHEYNCGDFITYLGTKSLLIDTMEAYKNVNLVFFDWLRAHEYADDTYLETYNFGHIDAIVLAGTPWIWDRCCESRKYFMLNKLLTRFPNAKKIGLGLGTCFPQRLYLDILDGQNIQQYFEHQIPNCPIFCDIFKQFDLLLTRDSVAQACFESYNIPSIYTFDTSVYAKNLICTQELNHSMIRDTKYLLIFTDPAATISGSYLSFDPNEFIQFQLNWAREHNADIITMFHADSAKLTELNIPHKFSTDTKYLYLHMQDYGHLLTPRIHMAVLGFISGITDVTILPIDTRFLTIVDLPFKIHQIGSIWPYIPAENNTALWYNIENMKQTIVTKLKTILEIK